jgi:hypothetical protein
LIEDGMSFLCQKQEGPLEGILGILGVVEHSGTDMENHVAMPFEEGGESRLVPASRKAGQKLTVADLPHWGRPCQPADLAENKPGS